MICNKSVTALLQHVTSDRKRGIEIFCFQSDVAACYSLLQRVTPDGISKISIGDQISWQVIDNI